MTGEAETHPFDADMSQDAPVDDVSKAPSVPANGPRNRPVVGNFMPQVFNPAPERQKPASRNASTHPLDGQLPGPRVCVAADDGNATDVVRPCGPPSCRRTTSTLRGARPLRPGPGSRPVSTCRGATRTTCRASGPMPRAWDWPRALRTPAPATSLSFPASDTSASWSHGTATPSPPSRATPPEGACPVRGCARRPTASPTASSASFIHLSRRAGGAGAAQLPLTGARRRQARPVPRPRLRSGPEPFPSLR